MTITIGREFGSGGRELARRLSEELDIAYYDSEILREIAERTSLSQSYIQEIIEKRPHPSFPIHVVRTFHTAISPIDEQANLIYQEQSATIKDLANKSDAVIVGRCADYILRDIHPFRIFVYADMESKIKRCNEKDTWHENLSERAMKAKILSVDRNRKKYYSFYTGNTWGAKENYDLMVNTSKVEIASLASHLAPYIKSLFV